MSNERIRPSSKRDRLLRSSEGKLLLPVLESLISKVNEVVAVVRGNNPHLANDAVNVVTSGVAVDLEGVVILSHEEATDYTAHIGSGTYHSAADSTNTLTATTVQNKLRTLINEIKTDYEAHRILTTGPVHGAADSTNAVTEASVAATVTKAEFVALGNDLKAQLNAHMGTVGSVHGAADATNLVTADDIDADTDWADIAAFVDALRAAYEAHRVLTTDSVHTNADSTNTVSTTALGTVQTHVDTLLTELKGDFNAHIALASSHPAIDKTMLITTADAATLATSVALANDFKTQYNDHISRAGEAAVLAAITSLDKDYT